MTEVIVEGDADKLPLAHEVNAGNVLVKEAFTKSEGAKTEGDYSEIIALCEEGIKSGATKENATYARSLAAWSYNRRGERFAELGNEEEALKDFTNAISHDPTHWRAMHNRGVSYATLGKPNEALADFSRALQLNRQYANTWFNRGEIHSDRGDFARAIADYAEAIRLAPGVRVLPRPRQDLQPDGPRPRGSGRPEREHQARSGKCRGPRDPRRSHVWPAATGRRRPPISATR